MLIIRTPLPFRVFTPVRACVCGVCVCVCVCLCMCVRAHVYACMGVGVPAYGAVVHACAIERSRVEFPLITVAHVFLFFLILLALLSFPWVATDSQWMLEYVVWCVMKMKK